MALYIRTIKNKGRGVFSDVPIGPDSLIECCPVIVIADTLESSWLQQTVLEYYFFSWEQAEVQQTALALGYGSLYNHSKTANARYEAIYEDGMIAFYSIRSIAAHEEISINYHGDPFSTKLTWFENRRVMYYD